MTFPPSTKEMLGMKLQSFGHLALGITNRGYFTRALYHHWFLAGASLMMHIGGKRGGHEGVRRNDWSQFWLVGKVLIFLCY